MHSFIHPYIHLSILESAFVKSPRLPWAALSVHLSGLMRAPAYGSNKYASAPYMVWLGPSSQRMRKKKSTQVDASRTHCDPMPVQPSQSEQGLRAQGCPSLGPTSQRGQ